MSAAPRMLHDDVPLSPAADPLTLLLAQFRAGVRAELRAELQAALADLAAYLEPEYLDVEAAAERASTNEAHMRRMLAAHPEFKKTNGTAITVHWREFNAWYREQRHIPGDDRPRRPSPRPSASRQKGGEG